MASTPAPRDAKERQHSLPTSACNSMERQQKTMDDCIDSTPMPVLDVQDLDGEDQNEEIELKRKLAFDEARESEGRSESLSEKDSAPSKPRTSRTTATKVSAQLLARIENNESGCDLKITALIPFVSLNSLCDALANNTSTERLDLEGCGVGDKGCLLIRDLFLKNKTIKHLDLQMNQISDVGCRHLSEILSQNVTLQKLYLGYNDIRDDGVYALIAAMRPQGQLEIVVNGNSYVSDQALARLDRALEQQWRPVMAKPRREASSPLPCSEKVEKLLKKPRVSEEGRKADKEKEAKPKGLKKQSAGRSLLPCSLAIDSTFYLSPPKKGSSSDDTCHTDPNLHRGAPFEYQILEKTNVRCPLFWKALDVPRSIEQTSFWSDLSKLSEGGDEHMRARKKLAERFHQQWTMLRTSISDQLEQECRDLQIQPNVGIFRSTCDFLARQKHYIKDSKKLTNRISEIKSEDIRKSVVETRVKELELKFRLNLRHMEEDIAREQKIEARVLAEMQGVKPHMQGGELPPGISQDSMIVHVPCPFQVDIVCCHVEADDAQDTVME
ncbi:hypothetical protein GUITHDRAFT_99045 [Guillardia theta CCMP2712]|uniref:Uncharacterized protein n=1 Tax=Guillardia theta (strain CCMP2712) TaxID=905079 RepID=L1K4K1_GUITC|nr:hypothetical protein GUITHDRAFT_99045 [Guillardia theta CCMP2712]EKX55263.1 hypothetical protein GUITHDRAFT_99045 [Guillardia theta CCMP2712]|eukprot:XP_005842243.1 hypothetical protein GUITHDRAFT_99045 [Guillardia theta CCMP2712]